MYTSYTNILKIFLLGTAILMIQCKNSTKGEDVVYDGSTKFEKIDQEPICDVSLIVILKG